MSYPIELQNQFLNSPTSKQWETIGIREHHGINLPLFSLHSKDSCGIGEYPDLLPLISWCKELGLDVIQLLPLNDTGHDTSPYSALSSLALNPIHIGLALLPFLDALPQLKNQLPDLQALKKSQHINYPKVIAGKERFLRDYYKAASANITKTQEYQQFVADNPWIKGYALFRTLREKENWRGWESWIPNIRDLNENVLDHLYKDYQDEISYHTFNQYLCFQQLQKVKDEATKLHIFIKGDIPILINRESADVWLYKPLFLLQFAAGAPPDMYSKQGQKWGFPIYNWDVIEFNHYNWWIDRLKVAEKFYHIYRLDHLVGFYRIWAFPQNRPASEAHFIPKDKAAWVPQGEKILKMMLKNCSMLPIAEDLGVVPTEVRNNMRSLGVCGTKVMRWERLWDLDKSFIPPENYFPESMTTVSTHDSETLIQWWKNQPEEAKDYAKLKGWKYTPKLSSEHHFDILRESHHSGSIFHINLLQEYLALIPGMTWPNPDDERINIPGKITTRNWSYRFVPSVEEITSEPKLKELMTQILS